MRKQIFVVMALLVILSLACNMSSNTPSAPTVESQAVQVETSQAEVTQEVQQPDNTPVPTLEPTPLPPTEVPSQPVSIKEGLASLNSYTLTIIFNSTGPDAKDATKITMIEQHSADLDAHLTHFTTDITSKDSSEPSNGENFIYTIGNDSCSGSKEDWSWATVPANQKEMQDLVQDMISISPVIQHPTFVSAETINGIPSNHFTFTISGLGVKSGAEVTANQGNYWLALDGRYIVKYTLVLETRTGPQSEILHEEISINLTDINQPVSIAFPQSCLDAKNATPTPSD
jgi:hypothetical protein